MSYQTFQQQCSVCHWRWNAAFGIVGMTLIAQPPKVCPYCKSPAIEHFAYGWDNDNPQQGQRTSGATERRDA